MADFNLFKTLGPITSTVFPQQVGDYFEQAAAENEPFPQGLGSSGGVGAVQRLPTP